MSLTGRLNGFNWAASVATTTASPPRFDYSTLPEADRQLAQEAAARIKVHRKRRHADTIAIGRELIAVKATLAHGQFGTWLKAEFSWTDRTARRFMVLAEGAENGQMSDLDGPDNPLDALFSSKWIIWGTPADLFQSLDQEFGFDLDVCALPTNAKCSRFFTPDDDGLKQPWDGVCWMNPPYGSAISDWMRKAVEESTRGATVVCLVPARTDTAWWHDYATKGEIRFLRGRLRFIGATSSAPFPSAIVIFRPAPTATEPEQLDYLSATTLIRAAVVRIGNRLESRALPALPEFLRTLAEQIESGEQ